jgi:radical SAM-linked protein
MRIRFRFAKLGKIRFTSQRDVARMWERALRRADLPLAYTEGFSPRPQLSFGLALPTGCESLAEYIDVVLDDSRPETAEVDVSGLPVRLTGLLPVGIEVEEAAVVDRRSESLQQMVTSCTWTMEFGGVSRVDLADRVAALLAADSVPIVRERKGREERDDLRPSVLALAVGDVRAGEYDGPVEPLGQDLGEPGERSGPGTVTVVAELATQPRGVRPVELVRGLIAATALPEAASDDGSRGIPVLDRACRTNQWIERDGRREEPLERRGGPVGVDRAGHALRRAS